MAEYEITFARSARKELESLDADMVRGYFPRLRICREIRDPTIALKCRAAGTYGE
ncbi:MAG: hypothetical protein JW787_12065 [Sedimentisphaerales bacterium]|nr:hypothetical protein [Sedimentisphaerales bacterium]